MRDEIRLIVNTEVRADSTASGYLDPLLIKSIKLSCQSCGMFSSARASMLPKSKTTIYICLTASLQLLKSAAETLGWTVGQIKLSWQS